MVDDDIFGGNIQTKNLTIKMSFISLPATFGLSRMKKVLINLCTISHNSAVVMSSFQFTSLNFFL